MARRSLDPARLLGAYEHIEVVDDRLVHQVAIADIRPSAHNPRRAFDGIEELAASLADHGLLQPIVARRLGPNTYELIAGHRRLEAAKRLGWTAIAAVVRDETEDQAYILTLVENLQREDLKPREEAAALLELERRLGSAVAAARAIKRSEAYVSKRKRVYQDIVLGPAVLTGELPVTTAEELLGVPDADDRQKLAARAQREGWDRPRVRAAVRTFAAKDGPAARATAVPAGVDEPRSRAALRQVQELRRTLECGPLAVLSPEAAQALRVFARDLADHLSDLPG
jgi:ParB family transcriptional regulator, chromosome partitioning protein